MFHEPMMALVRCLALASELVAGGMLLQAKTMFPKGVDHDFGTVLSGMPAKHVFRMVNTSKAPLHIVSLRCT
jgi:hypothetical protein